MSYKHYVHIKAHYIKRGFIRFYNKPQISTRKKRPKMTKRRLYERGEEIIKCGLRKREIKKTFST